MPAKLPGEMSCGDANRPQSDQADRHTEATRTGRYEHIRRYLTGAEPAAGRRRRRTRHGADVNRPAGEEDAIGYLRTRQIALTSACCSGTPMAQVTHRSRPSSRPCPTGRQIWRGTSTPRSPPTRAGDSAVECQEPGGKLLRPGVSALLAVLGWLRHRHRVSGPFQSVGVATMRTRYLRPATCVKLRCRGPAVGAVRCNCFAVGGCV